MNVDVGRDREIGAANRRTAMTLGAVVLGMFGFGYALVPLYEIICDLTGLNGTTRRLDAATASTALVDGNREVTVQFLGQTNGLPWDFYPLTKVVKVRPGEATPIEFFAHNRGRTAMIGTAVHSVSPSEAARYFVKTDCFCFSEQRLGAGESQVMPVRFVVSSHLPRSVSTMTLAYTFFLKPIANKPDAIQRGLALLNEPPLLRLEQRLCRRSESPG